MADVKTIQTRLQLKYDTYANWTDDTTEGVGANLVLLKGEIGICEIETNTAGDPNVAPTVLFKVGNGEKKFSELKWASATAADVYSWAKASDVVFDEVIEKDDEGNETGRKHFIRFKSGDTVVKELDLSTFITDAEVKAITDPLATRIAAVEAILGQGETGDAGSIADQITDLAGRLDDLEGDGEGSVAHALAEAQGYTDEKIGTAAVGNEGEDGYKAATGLRKEIADAVAAEKAARVAAETAQATKDAEQDKAISDEVKAREDADKAITDVIGTGFEATETGTVAAKVKAAQDAADAAKKAADDAQADVDALTAADGQVTANTAAIAQLQADLETEAGARADADAAINAKIGGSFTAESTVADAITAASNAASTADGKAVAAQNAVDALTGTDGPVTKNAADIAQLQTDLAAEVKTRGETDTDHENRIKAMEAFFEGAASDEGEGESLKNALDTLVEIQNLLSTEEGAAVGELLDAITALEGVVGDDESGLVKDMAEAQTNIGELNDDVATLQDIVDGYTGKGSIKTAVDAAAELAQDGVDAAGVAQAAAEAADGKAVDAQNRVGALEGTVPGIKTTAEDAQNRVAALEPKVEQAEKDIDALEAIVKTGADSNANLRSAITDLEALVEDEAKGNEALYTEVTRIAGLVDDEEAGLAATHEIAAQAATDIAALEPRVQTAEEAITNITKADGLIAIAKQEAIDAAATDASNKVAVALAEAQTHANNLNTAMDTRVESLETDVSEIKGDYLKAADVYIFQCGSSKTVTHTAPAN